MSSVGRCLRGCAVATFAASAFVHALADAQVPPGAKQDAYDQMMVVRSSTVPNLVGQPESRVDELLGPSHLVQGNVSSRPGDRAAGTVLGQSPQAGEKVRWGTHVDLVVSSGATGQANPIRVPDVVGTTTPVGEARLTQERLRVGSVQSEASPVATGAIIRQDPRAGSVAQLDTMVDLVVSSGPAAMDRRTRVPGVVERRVADAQSVLEQAGLQVGQVTRQNDGAPADTVVRQSPSAGSLVAANARVDLFVSDGGAAGAVKPVRVPDVVQHPFTGGDTQELLGKATLHVGVVRRQSSPAGSGTVIGQSPAAGTLVSGGSAVDLIVSAGLDTVTVPDVVGVAGAVATQRIGNARLATTARTVPGSEPEGTVIEQQPGAGARVNPGSDVAVDLSDGTLVIVPRLDDRDATAAEAILVKTGLRFERTTQPSKAQPDIVIAQQPVAGTTVKRDTAIRVVVAIPLSAPTATTDGPIVTMPDVVGLAVGDARARIGANLTMEVRRVDSASVRGDRVIAQDPVAGSPVTSGTKVSVDIPRGVPRPWAVKTIVVVVVLLVGAVAAALWPPVRYRVLMNHRRVVTAIDPPVIDGPVVDLRVHVEHGDRTLHEDP